MKRIVCISDTHTKHTNLVIPKCDILISSGDYSFKGSINEVIAFHSWLNQQPATHKISVQGNHELGVEENFNVYKQIAKEKCPGVHFIEEGLVEIDGLKIWGSAITPWFGDWAWNRRRNEIDKHWERIPKDIDILVTHGPPYGILDDTELNGRVGCVSLRQKLHDCKNLLLHCFGHIHPQYGTEKVNNTIYANASICNQYYEAVNNPIIIDLDKQSKSVKIL